MGEQAKISDFIILSAAFIGDEMSAEFGLIPPSFLPLGGKRLFEHQAKLSTGKTHISLPEEYDILPIDQPRLKQQSINVIRVQKGLNLRGSLQNVLQQIKPTGPVEVLFGDTLIYGPCPESQDLISFQNDPAHHFWSYFSDADPAKPFVSGFGDGITERRILCGHFRFSNAQALIEALETAPDFVQALNLYEKQIPFKKCMVETWFDFGHLSLYHQSKKNFSVARSFNSVKSDGKSVRKSSTQTDKIRAEASWYRNLPTELKLHTPKFLGDDDQDFQAGYRMEYIFQPLLADLFVFGNLPGHVWSQILRSCFEFLKITSREKPPSGSPETAAIFADDFFDFMFATKTKNRLAEFLDSAAIKTGTKFVINGHKLPAVNGIIDILLQNIRPTKSDDISLMHGDFFFGNTFFDFRSTNVTVIDPRAMLAAGAPTIYGDHRYDIAKLAHSIIGSYDHIINGRSTLTMHGSDNWNFIPSDVPKPAGLVKMMFAKSEKEFGIGRVELLSMTALLFFSMLPLHADSTQRQEHLFANALWLTAQALEQP